MSITTVVGGPAEVKQSDLRYEQAKLGRSKTGAYEIGGFSIEGVSVGGQETCVMVPAMKVAFDIGRCPERAISQDFLFISHAHMDHIVCLLHLSSLSGRGVCNILGFSSRRISLEVVQKFLMLWQLMKSLKYAKVSVLYLTV